MANAKDTRPFHVRYGWWPTGEVSYSEIAIAFFALISVIVAALTYFATSRYAEITANTFRAQYRPYLSLRPLKSDEKHVIELHPETRQMCLNWTFKNVGDVPAYEIDGNAQVLIFGEKQEIAIVRNYLAPRDSTEPAVCLVTGKYDLVAEGMKKRDADLPVTVAFSLTYKGINEQGYRYYKNADYHNVIENFGTTAEGDCEEDPGAKKSKPEKCLGGSVSR